MPTNTQGTKTAAHLSSKLMSYLVSQTAWDTAWEVVGAGPITPSQHQFVVRDPDAETEFVIVISKRSTSPAIQATVVKETHGTATEADLAP